MNYKHLENGLLMPSYDPEKSVKGIHSKIRQYLDTNKSVVFFLLDGFGSNLVEKHQGISSLSNLLQKSKYTNISTIFPSATTPYMTLNATGLLPPESGLLEYNAYIEDENVEVLPFAKLGGEPNSWKLKDDASIFWNYQNFLDSLNTQTFIHTPNYLAESRWTNITKGQDTKVLGYANLAEGFDNVYKNLQSGAYHFFYFPNIDSTSHEFGVYSPEVREEITNFFNNLEESKLIKNKSLANKYIFSADHGQTDKLTETVYLEQIIPDIAKYFKTNTKGLPILPCGSFRNLFLHIKDSELPNVKERLVKGLSGHSMVLDLEKVFEIGLFGDFKYNKKYEERFGNLLILPYPKHSVWINDPRLDYLEKGTHGGLSRDELTVPLIEY